MVIDRESGLRKGCGIAFEYRFEWTIFQRTLFHQFAHFATLFIHHHRFGAVQAKQPPDDTRAPCVLQVDDYIEWRAPAEIEQFVGTAQPAVVAANVGTDKLDVRKTVEQRS